MESANVYWSTMILMERYNFNGIYCIFIESNQISMESTRFKFNNLYLMEIWQIYIESLFFYWILMIFMESVGFQLNLKDLFLNNYDFVRIRNVFLTNLHDLYGIIYLLMESLTLLIESLWFLLNLYICIKSIWFLLNQQYFNKINTFFYRTQRFCFESIGFSLNLTDCIGIITILMES